MAKSKTAIANMALAHLAVGRGIASLDERSPEARACNQFYGQALDEVLREWSWPFATRRERLAVLVDYTQNPNEAESGGQLWHFGYAYPPDAVYIRSIVQPMYRVPDAALIPTYEIAQAPDGSRMILADQPEAVVEYTARVEDPNVYPPDFTSALSLLLASYIAPTVTGGDQFRLGLLAHERYRDRLSAAKAAAANEMRRDREPDNTDLVRGRF